MAGNDGEVRRRINDGGNDGMADRRGPTAASRSCQHLRNGATNHSFVVRSV